MPRFLFASAVVGGGVGWERKEATFFLGEVFRGVCVFFCFVMAFVWFGKALF